MATTNLDSLSLSGTLAVTGAITATGGVTGGVTGTLVGGVQLPVAVITGDGAITITPGSVHFTKAGAGAITIAAPTAVTHDGYVLVLVAGTAQAHVVTSATVGFNAKGSSGTLTFGGAIGDSAVIIARNGNWYVVSVKGVTIA